MDQYERQSRRPTKPVTRAGQLMSGPAYPVTPSKPLVRRHTERPAGQHPAFAPSHTATKQGSGYPPFVPPRTHTDFSESSRSSRRRDHRTHDHDHARDYNHGPNQRERRVNFPSHYDSGSSSDASDSDRGRPTFRADSRGEKAYGEPRRARRELDPFLPYGVKPRDGSFIITTHRPPVQPRRRSMSLMKCLTQAGLGMFNINPRWAKGRPLL